MCGGNYDEATCREVDWSTYTLAPAPTTAPATAPTTTTTTTTAVTTTTPIYAPTTAPTTAAIPTISAPVPVTLTPLLERNFEKLILNESLEAEEQ